MSIRFIAFLSGAAIVVVLLVGSYMKGVEAGANKEKAKAAEVIADYQAKQSKLIKELDEARKQTRIEYRDRVKVIRETPDPSGCADADIPDGIMHELDPVS